jgi:hypothetical protein
MLPILHCCFAEIQYNKDNFVDLGHTAYDRIMTQFLGSHFQNEF